MTTRGDQARTPGRTTSPTNRPWITVWTGESLFSRLIRTVILPLMGSKRVLQDIERHSRQLERARIAGEAQPPRKLKRRYRITSRTYAGHHAFVVEPRNGPARRTILYIHGGAYVANMMLFQWNLVAGLAAGNDARIIVPHYPLAPENDWRPGFAMMTALYDSLLAETSAGSIVLAGDSAGAGFALSFAQLLRDRERPLPARLLLYSPWLDLREDNPEQAAMDPADPMLARPVLVWSARHWAGDTPLDDPRISPVLGDLRGLPPTLVFSGTADLLHPDALALIARARAADCPMWLIVGERMTHAWSVLPTREAARLHAASAAFLC
jgi:acetyl esterase/lipase